MLRSVIIISLLGCSLLEVSTLQNYGIDPRDGLQNNQELGVPKYEDFQIHQRQARAINGGIANSNRLRERFERPESVRFHREGLKADNFLHEGQDDHHEKPRANVWFRYYFHPMEEHRFDYQPIVRQTRDYEPITFNRAYFRANHGFGFNEWGG